MRLLLVHQPNLTTLPPLSTAAHCRAFSGAQLVLQAAVGWRCAGDLPFCLLLQTMLFVAFNKASGIGVHWCALVCIPGGAELPGNVACGLQQGGWAGNGQIPGQGASSVMREPCNVRHTRGSQVQRGLQLHCPCMLACSA